jgi:uncharacterized protein (UPF0264 family)
MNVHCLSRADGCMMPLPMTMVSRQSERIERSFSVGEFKRLAIDELDELITRVREREELASSHGFVKRTPTPLLSHMTLEELASRVRGAASALGEQFPARRSFAQRASESLQALLSARDSGLLVLEAYHRMLDLADEVLERPHGDTGGRLRMTADARRIYLLATSDHAQTPVGSAAAEDAEDLRFLAATVELLGRLREAGHAPDRDEVTALRAAYRLIERGVQLPTAYQSLGTSGFRPVQTCLSLADPGEGHIRITCQDARLMQGTVIHVEHIDRDKEFNKELVEPYRLPAAINAARVRLHAGAAAPVTAFIGRPVFESQHVRRDLLKSVHLIASACTAMFMNGIADCKIGIERMTASEAVEVMRGIVGNVFRDSSRQYLSAAFNLNTPILHDLDGQKREVTDRFELGLLGIELARRGGFDKVTWDGASNKVPSEPIVDQLTHAQLVELVHRAHEVGLETYISAGLLPHHMRVATHAGVGGVGIGTSLHYIDPDTKLMGALKPEAILEVLHVRDEAAREPLGRAAWLLARLDRLYFEKALSQDDEPLRQQLFAAVRERNEAQASALIERLGHVEAMDVDRGHPVLARAHRLLEATSPLAQVRRAGEWPHLRATVARLAAMHDVSALKELL